MSALPKVQQIAVAEAERATSKGLAAWKKNRLCRWSRTDTARWLNDRAPAVLAWLRRRQGDWPLENERIGYWLNLYSRRVFDRAHARLTAGRNDEERELLLPSEVLK